MPTVTSGSSQNQRVNAMTAAAITTPKLPRASLQHLEIRRLHVEAVLAALVEERHRNQVGAEAGDRHGDHQARADLVRLEQPEVCLVEEKPHHHQQQLRVDERGENLGTVQAERVLLGRHPLGERHRSVGERQRRDVGEEVRGVREQREASRGEAAGDLDDQEDAGETEDAAQASAVELAIAALRRAHASRSSCAIAARLPSPADASRARHRIRSQVGFWSG